MPARIVCLDRDREEVESRLPLPVQAVAPDQLAYVVYTSGSTGRPKGVQVPHRGLLNLVRWDLRVHGTGPGDHRTQVASLGFDASVWEIWSSLASGATLHLAQDETRLDPQRLAAWMAGRGVTASFLPTPLAEALLAAGGPQIPTLRRLMVGGDRLVLRPEPGSGFILSNLYGPAEAAVVATAGPVPPRGSAESLTLGRPIDGLWVHLLDRSLQPVPPGVAGELWVGGPALARGYLGDPGRTAERFLPDPWRTGERLYRTGDLCRYRGDGEIEFLGRVDHQVKIRGQRIELGEIETALAALPGVREAAVVAPEDRGERRLVAYVVASVAGEVTADDLRRSLREQLPDAMVPAAFVTLDALPLTPNGKVDRKALSLLRAAPEAGRAPEEHLAPRTPVEEVVAGIWAELLGLERVGVDGDFFALGGHSLLAAQVISRLRRAFGVELPVRDLFEAPTVADLAARVEAARRAGGALSVPALLPMPETSRHGALPLSFAQRRLWFIDQLEPGSPLYNMPVALRVAGPLRPEVLRRCLGEIVRRHEALRTVFQLDGDAPVQVILRPAPFALPLVDLSALPGTAREAAAFALAAQEAGLPFDLARGLKLRGVLLRLAAEDHAVALTAHHVASDGWSMGILVNEVTVLYGAFAQGEPSALAALAALAALPELPVQYADFAVWQHSWLRGEVLEREVDWWRRQLAGLPPLLELPTDRPRPAVQSYRGAARPVRLPAGLTRGLEALGRSEGATLFMVLLAGFQALLARYSGQTDLAVGTPIAGRGQVETEGLIGFFANTLVLRGDLTHERDGAPSFRELVGRVRETALAAYLHQDVPFEKLVEELAPGRSLAHTPLFQVMLAFQNLPLGAVEMGGLALSPLHGQGGDGQGPAKFDLSLSLTETDEGLAGSLLYAAALFDRATVQRLLDHLERLLGAAAAAPERCVADLDLLSPAQRSQLLVEWNDTARDHPALPVHRLFARRAASLPDAVAVRTDDRSLTYGELAARVRAQAAHLRTLGAGPERIVAVCLERSADLVTALLAVLASGAAYLPLDPRDPEERRAQILDDARPLLLLTRQELAAGTESVPAVCVEDLPVDLPAGPEADAMPDADTPAHALAYVLYTSGTTGRPKGVAVDHASLSAYLAWIGGVLEGAGVRWLPLLSSVTFDASLKQLFVPLLRGEAVRVVSEEARLQPERLLEILGEAPGAGCNTVPSLWEGLLGTLERGEAAPPADLRALFLGGERLPEELAARTRRLLPGVAVYNLYGPTEATANAAWSRVGSRVGSRVDEAGGVALGRPVGNAHLVLADRHLRPVPLGATGEICVGGAGVARGYLGQPALTAERFVPDPFGDVSGGRLYRTGDLARQRPDGALDFLGRLDHQVKVRGFRIELGEIETALAALPGVREAAVMVREDAAGPPRLVAWVAADPEDADTGALREALGARLPDYMVPSAFVTLPALPLTANGKVDRQALALTSASPDWQGAAEGWQPPRTPIEEVVAGIWAELLGLARVGANDHFFELGGHSLLATQVTSRLRRAFGVELPVRDLFEAPTVAGLAARVEAARRSGAGLEVPPLRPMPLTSREGAPPLSFAQQRLWFLDQLEPGTALYNLPVALRAAGPLDPGVLALTLGEIVRRHEALRTVFAAPEGKPVQVIVPPAPFALPLVDLSGLPEPAREAAVPALALEEAGRPFDLARDPMLRGLLVRLAAADHAVALTLHHVASDGWSMGLLVREVAALYPALYAAPAEGRPSPLPELPVQYADFALWQRSWLKGEVLDGEIAWWRRQLAGLPPLLELPTDRPRPAVQSFRGASRIVRLPAELSRQAEALSRREGATLFMVLLAAFQALLGRYSGQPDLAVGSPVAGRNRIEVEDLIGFFVNTVVLRGDLAGEPTFGELLGRVRETTLSAYAHQDLPFEKLVQELAPDRSLAHTPLFQVLFALQNLPARTIELPGLSLSPVALQPATAKFDLELTVTEGEDGLSARLDFASDLFDPSTVLRLGGHLEALLEAVTADPGRRLGELPLLSAAERHQLAAEWNDTPVPAGMPEMPAMSAITELFAAQVRRTPDALAVVRAGDEAAGLTYRELDRRVGRLAGRLRALGVGPEVPVGLCVEHGPELAVAVLGIFRSGGAYVPLDPAHPPARLAFLLEDSAVPVLVTQTHLLEALPDHGARTVLLDPLDPSAMPEGEGEEGEAAPLAAPAPGDLAYRIYTSGTTGRPKAVEVEHGMLAATLAATREWFGLGEGDRMPCLALSTFDIFLFELLSPLLAGGTAVLFPLRPTLDVERLVDHLGELTSLHAVPALMRGLVDTLRRRGPAAPDVGRMRQVFTGGDAVPADLLEDLRQVFPAAQVWVLYGPTEATILCSAHAVPPAPEPARPLLGRPLPGAVLHVRDAAGELLPAGVPGELWIGGPGVTRGYLGREELTAEKFVPRGGERFYRSGDRVRRLADGTLEFLGRLDHQVKVRGFRIELGEIEAALSEVPGVREALVLVREDQPGDRRLVAYVVGEAEVPDTAELRQALRDRLPEYMVPAAFVTLVALPLTINGKVDRNALPAPEWQGGRESYVAPRGRREEVLAEVWAQVLRLPRVGVEDNFFELGGDSILSIQIVARARQAGLLVTTRQVFEHQTVAALARHAQLADVVDTTDAAGTAGAVRPPQGPVSGEVPLTPIQRRFFEQGVADPHHFNQALLLEPAEPLGSGALAALEQAVAALVEHHDALRLRFAESPSGWRQENAPAESVAPFHQVDLSALPAPRRLAACERAAAALQAGFDLSAGPLTRLCLFDSGPGEPARLLWVLHHLVVDGVSWRVLLEDLEAAYRQAVLGQRPALPPKTSSFQEWARRLSAHAGSEELARELPYWREAAGAAVPGLPVDFPSGGNLVADEATVAFELSPEETADLLQTVPAACGSRIDEALLSGLARALAGWTGSPRLRVDLEGHGREPLFDDLDVSRTVGWFTSLYPVVLAAGEAGAIGDIGPGEALASVRERLRAVPGRGIGYGLLRHLADRDEARLLAAAPAAEVSFNYLGQVDGSFGERSLFRVSPVSAGPSRSPRARRSHLLEVAGLVAGGRLRITLTYGSRTHRRETAERLAAAYAGALRELIQHARESKETLAASPLRQEEGGSAWSPLVPIQPRGERMPLFCVHALGGEVLSYYQLARALGADQPLYGLQARPVDGQTPPQATVEEMAAEYIESVRSLQPHGPYLLAGYSFGGVVAFEMARQLILAGEKVGLLALLDAVIPPGDETAEVDTAAIVIDFLRYVVGQQGRTLEIDADALRGLSLDSQLARGVEILGGGEPLGPGFEIPVLRGLALGWSARATAAERYRASLYPGRITVLRASSLDPVALLALSPQRRQVREAPTLGWNAVAGDVEVQTVPGTHQTIIEAPNVEVLAAVLTMCIARAEEESETVSRAPALAGAPT